MKGTLTLDRRLLKKASRLVDKINRPRSRDIRGELMGRYLETLGEGGFENLDVIAYRLGVGRPTAGRYLRAQRSLERLEARILFGED